MTRFSTWIGMTLLVALGGAVMAQRGGPPGGGPGRFFFAGPGAQPWSRTTLLSMPEVQTELALRDEQKQRLAAILEEQREATRSALGNMDFRDLEGLEPQERDARLAEVRKRAEEAGRKSDEKASQLLDEKQLARLNQLQLQREGPEALARTEIARRVGLSQEQERQIARIAESLPRQPDRVRRFGPGDPGGPPDFARMEDDRRKLQGEMLAVLTGEQKSRWTQLLGAEFRFPEGPLFGGPGREGFGPGGPMGGERKLVATFDKDADGRLNAVERAEARRSVQGQGQRGPGGRGPGPGPGFGPRGGEETAGKPGPRVSPADVQPIPDAPLYAPHVLRTLFLNFENDDWEAELADFHNTDVEVPATLTVDGKTYPQVGVHFRGMSSYGAVPEGLKRSLNISLDFVNEKQRLYGYKTLNLLNAHGDASLLSSVLYSHIARAYIRAPKANLVKVVINGESWGIYANLQQFNKEFTEENYKSTKGARWKVSGSPGGGGGLEYLGDDLESYKRRYEIKSADNEKSWRALRDLCRTLNNTPPEKLEEALRPIVHLDGLLWFLALDVALINNDGYWVRASDYSLYLDEKGKFHFIPHDMNEAFRPGGGPGGPGGGPGFARSPGGFGPGGPGFGPPGQGPEGAPPDRPPPPPDRPPPPPGAGGARDGERGPPPQRERGPDERGPGAPGGPGMGGGIELDPLVALDDPRKPLRSKVLAVPSLRARYLDCVRTIAEKSLDWKHLGPVVASYRQLVEKEVEADTRKLTTLEAFLRATADEPPAVGASARPGGRGRETSLRSFADQRRAYLLKRLEAIAGEPSSGETSP